MWGGSMGERVRSSASRLAGKGCNTSAFDSLTLDEDWRSTISNHSTIPSNSKFRDSTADMQL
eukprot:scaffold3356_cov264-Pinguiococcus_pyrenoidosus.AAC.10